MGLMILPCLCVLTTPVLAADNAEGLLLEARFDVADRWAAGPAFGSTAAADGLELIPGREGQALHVPEGARAALRLSRPLPHRTGTIGLWVRPNFSSSDESDRVLFVAPGRSGESHDNWQMQWLKEGQLLVRAGKMGVNELRLDGLRFAAGQWIHLAMAWDARNLTAYLDGRRAAADLGLDLSIEPGAVIHLGAWPDGSRWADAALDELRVHDRKLADSEIAALAGGTTGKAFGPPPPATREVTRPGPLPSPSPDDPELLVHLPLDQWPVPRTRPIRPKGGPLAIKSVPGRFGQAVEFTRGGLALNVGDLFPHDRGTVALWVRPNWDGGHDESKVFFHVKSSSTSGVDNYHLQIWGGALSARAGGMRAEGKPGADARSAAVREWRAGHWRHLALAWSPERILLYVDGEPADGSDDVAYPYRPLARLAVGCWSDGTRSAEAALDDFRVYTTDLSAEEIRSLFERNVRK